MLQKSALAACRVALRPLVRMLLAHGVMHKEFVALSKEIYVDVARERYGIRGRPTNTARVALLTGLDRKEVTRVRKTIEERSDSAQAPARRQDRIARVLSGWFQDPDYLDADGMPLRLPLAGPAPSYESLVGRYGGDVPPVTILRELRRTQAVHVDDAGVSALRRNYRLDTADPESISRAGSVLADIGQTVTHNLYREPDEASRFEARASNRQIPEAAVPAYREMLNREAQRLLEKVDAWLTRHEIDPDTAEHSSTPVTRLGVGVYWIQSMDGNVCSQPE